MQKLCCVRTRQQFSASLDYFCHQLTNPYLHQFSTISGGNCECPLLCHRLIKKQVCSGGLKIVAHSIFTIVHANTCHHCLQASIRASYCFEQVPNSCMFIQEGTQHAQRIVALTQMHSDAELWTPLE